MNAAIRRTALFLGLAFLTLFVNLNYIQATRSEDLNNDPRNRRQIIREFGTRRGDILASDNTVLAHSIDSGDARYRYIREYPQKALFGHLTGYYSFFYGASALERSYDDVLQGREPARAGRFIDELLGREPAGNTIRLTVDPVLQGLARRAFHGQEGGAAVLDSRTGAILALYGDPGFDPNPLSGTPSDQTRIQEAWSKISSNPEQPLLSKAFAERYPPGSAFKVVVATAGMLSGMTPSTALPDPSVLDLPQTDRVLPNWQGGSCVGGSISMSTALRVSCNTYFAQTAMRIGPKRLDGVARRFGFGSGFDAGITVAPSCVVSIPGAGCANARDLAPPFTAYSGIGQNSVGVTPLQMAIVTAAAENGGYRVDPFLVERIIDPTGETIAKSKAQRTRIMSKKVAKWLDEMMVGVVQYGTGSVVGFRDGSSGIIGGKTGTAQTREGEAPHVWFIAYGPGVSVAVVVEHGGELGNEATGGRVAGPIAKVLLEKAMARLARAAQNPIPAPSDVPVPAPSFPTATSSPTEAP